MKKKKNFDLTPIGMTLFEIWNIQKPSTIASQCIFRTLSYSEPCLCNPGNSEPWQTGNSGIFRNLTYLKLKHIRNPHKDMRWCVLQK